VLALICVNASFKDDDFSPRVRRESGSVLKASNENPRSSALVCRTTQKDGGPARRRPPFQGLRPSQALGAWLDQGSHWSVASLWWPRCSPTTFITMTANEVESVEYCDALAMLERRRKEAFAHWAIWPGRPTAIR
jgi:hypothetical protein